MMRITDEMLRWLLARDPSDPEALKEMRRRVYYQVLRRLPNPTGVCPHGKRIEWDNRGTYSSGYPIHFVERPDGTRRFEDGYCELFHGIIDDPDPPDRARLLALLRTLA